MYQDLQENFTLKKTLSTGDAFLSIRSLESIQRRNSNASTGASSRRSTLPLSNFKVILLGDCNVGKTSLISQFTKQEFSYERVPTTKIEEVVHYRMPLKQKEHTVDLSESQMSISLNSSSVQQVIDLEIWDTLGQEKYSSLVSSYYKNTQGVMIVYDVTSMESFLNVKSWLIELEEHIPTMH